MEQFDVSSVDLNRSRLNKASPAKWRNMLIGLCAGLSLGAAVAPPAQARAADVAHPAVHHLHFTQDSVDLIQDAKASLGLSDQEAEGLAARTFDNDKIVAQAKMLDGHHSLVEANSAYIVTLDKNGYVMMAGSGTFVQGADDHGYPRIITVRHVGDAAGYLSVPGRDGDRADFGQTLIFNSGGQLLGFMSPTVHNIMIPGYNRPGDDTATMVSIDTTRPHNDALLRQMSGVPLYHGLPVGDYRAAYNGNVSVAPGASGGGVIYTNPETGQWGLIGVVSSLDPKDISLSDLVPAKGQDMLSKIVGDDNTLSQDIRERAGHGVVIGLGSQELLSYVHGSQPDWIKPQASYSTAYSFNFGENIESYVDKIGLTKMAQPFDYSNVIRSEAHDILLGFNTAKGGNEVESGDDLQMITQNNRDVLSSPEDQANVPAAPSL